VKSYRKKSVVVEAVQFVKDSTWEAGTNIFEIDDWIHAHDGDTAPRPPDALGIVTLEGTMWAGIGDWVIRGVKGEFYPCKPDIFDAIYEPEPANSAVLREQEETSMPNKERGLFEKYRVERVDGKPVKWSFVLEDTDPLAIPALSAYATAARMAGYGRLSFDLEVKVGSLIRKSREQEEEREKANGHN
jgi:hypothetical protein